ncbi:MAG TPA: hypothetical protein VHJ17_13510 [Thermomonospora sp.]|nr:hypothetical protein [Thermomonospora sp.]
MAKAREQEARRLWEALNERQQTYLTVIYNADQAAEADNRGAWTAGARSLPASEWRWIPYGPVGNADGATGYLQDRLTWRGVRDQGAGATLKTLEERGLIATRSHEGLLVDYHLEVRLTDLGRRVCRAGGVDPARARSRKRGMLSEGLWRMLVEVWEADGNDDGGHPVWMHSGAWERLTSRTPPLVSLNPAPPHARHRATYRATLTEDGRQHYRDRWADYARAYPAVDAPHPDGDTIWPAEADEALSDLGSRGRWLGQELIAAAAAREQLATLAETVDDIDLPQAVPTTDLPEGLRSLVRTRDRAAASCLRAIGRATDRYRAAIQRETDKYRQVLEEHRASLEEPYRTACIHYALAAVAVVQAVADGRDPVTALAQVDPTTVTVWPWVPDRPTTGLPEVDAALATAHRQAGGGQPKPRRSRRRAPEPTSPSLLLEGQKLLDYGGALEKFVQDGQLARLMLRNSALSP